jgi:hypothetical protein
MDGWRNEQRIEDDWKIVEKEGGHKPYKYHESTKLRVSPLLWQVERRRVAKTKVPSKSSSILSQNHRKRVFHPPIIVPRLNPYINRCDQHMIQLCRSTCRTGILSVASEDKEHPHARITPTNPCILRYAMRSVWLMGHQVTGSRSCGVPQDG